MIRIPTYQDKSSKFRQEILLGGRTLELALRWNSRTECWFMDIKDLISSDMVSAIKVVPNWLLLRMYKSELPELRGDFIAKAVNTEVAEITYDNLNKDFVLFFLTEAEAFSWEVDNGVRSSL